MKWGELEAQMGPMDWRRAAVPGFQSPFLMMERFPKQRRPVLGAAVPSGSHRLCPALDLAHLV